MRKTSRRAQRSKRYRDEPGYQSILIQDRNDVAVRKWVRRIPLMDLSVPQSGFHRDPNPFWLFFINGFEHGRLRKEIAQEASRIFVDEAIRIGAIPPTKTVADVRESDLERLADESEGFMQAIADAQFIFETGPEFHSQFEWLTDFAGKHFALARLGRENAYDSFDDPDPRRTLVAAAQSHRFTPPYVDADGYVRLFHDGDEPPSTPADVTAFQTAGTAV